MAVPRTYANAAQAPDAPASQLLLRYKGQPLRSQEQFLRAVLEVQFREMEQKLLQGSTVAGGSGSGSGSGHGGYGQDEKRLSMPVETRLSITYELLKREKKCEEDALFAAAKGAVQELVLDATCQQSAAVGVSDGECALLAAIGRGPLSGASTAHRRCAL